MRDDIFLQTRGGVRIDSFNMSAPSSEIHIAPDYIELVGYGKSFRFARGSIKELRVSRGFLTDGVRILHDRPDYPTTLIFWSPDLVALHAAIRDRGYAISDLPIVWWAGTITALKKVFQSIRSSLGT